jgi:hypothetical protein
LKLYNMCNKYTGNKYINNKYIGNKYILITCIFITHIVHNNIYYYIKWLNYYYFFIIYMDTCSYFKKSYSPNSFYDIWINNNNKFLWYIINDNKK